MKTSLRARAVVSFVACFGALLTACQSAGAPGATSLEDGAAGEPVLYDQVLYENGRIWLDAMAADHVHAMLVADGHVLAIGSEAQRLAGSHRMLASMRRVDLGGAVVVPGLQDAHGHVANLGELLETLDLSACTSFEEVVALVAAEAGQRPRGEWIVGRGWDQTRWPGGDFPHHAALSAASPDHPVYLRRVDGHAALANAHALRLAGLLGASGAQAPVVPDPEGGVVHRDEDGAPTGVLIDAAMGLVGELRPEPSREEIRRRLLAAQEALVGAGLVAVHDMSLAPAVLAEQRRLEREGLWKLRVLGYLWANDGMTAEIARSPGATDADPHAKIRVRGAKLMLDGALGSRGAALFEDYHDAPGVRGHLLMEPSAFAQLLDAVVEAGLQPAVHAIGDQANRVLLDAYADRIARDPSFVRMRPRVEHAQVVSPQDLRRFEALGVVLSMQPTHATSDMRWAEARLGPERVRGAYAWRRLAEDPATLAFGSDFPVERYAPLEGLYAARTRRDREGNPLGGWFADQRLSAREALAAFTSGAARAVGEESLRGHLRPGAAADFTVLDVDPVNDAAEALLSARVLRTVIDGETVFEAGS